ncbi:hypothetical protein H639_10027 [Cutibacterium avidum TM16]|nr:hypothetical protein H639_10027 [Cutibacterium avidum TM16]
MASRIETAIITVTRMGRHLSRRVRSMTWVVMRAVWTRMSRISQVRIRHKWGGDNTRAITTVKMTRPAKSTWMPICMPTSMTTARPR